VFSKKVLTADIKMGRSVECRIFEVTQKWDLGKSGQLCTLNRTVLLLYFREVFVEQYGWCTILKCNFFIQARKIASFGFFYSVIDMIRSIPIVIRTILIEQ
jgi:hypothetical protein